MTTPEVLARLARCEANMEALMDRRRALVDAAKRARRAEFARGGGGMKSAKGGKSSKKGKGGATASKGGLCCKGEGGRFATGNNYGAKGGARSSQKAAAKRVGDRLAIKSKEGKAAAQARSAADGPKGGIAGMIARSKAASAAGAKVAVGREKAALEKKQARNAKTREKRAAKKAEGQKAAAPAQPKAPGRGTAERLSRAVSVRDARAGVQRVSKDTPITEKVSTKGGVKTVEIRRGAASMKIVASGGTFNVVTKVGGKTIEQDFDSMRSAKEFARRNIGQVGYVDKDGSLRARHDAPARGETRRSNIIAGRSREAGIKAMVAKSKAAAAGKKNEVNRRAWREKQAAEKAQSERIRKEVEADSAARKARGLGARREVDSRPSAEARRRRILERAGDKLAEAREGAGKNKARDIKKDARGRTSPESASRRKNLAAEIKRARKAIQKADPKTVAKLAEQKARAARRDARQGKLPLDKSDRAATLKRMTDRSRVASGKAGAKNAADKRAAKDQWDKVALQKSMPSPKRVAAVTKALDKASAPSQRAAEKVALGPVVARVRAEKEAALTALGPKPVNRTEGTQNDGPTRRWISEKQAIEARHVVPVAPPSPSLLARPLADPARMRAESSKMDEAFARAPGARDNLVPLAAVRNAMPHLSRPEFDRVLNEKRDRDEFGLESHEGLSHPAHPELRAAAMREAGSELIYISRRRS